MSAKASDVAWMAELRERAQAWLRATEADDEAHWDADPVGISGRAPWQANRSRDYIDLYFAFAMAQIGAMAESRTMTQNAAASLAGPDAPHAFLLAAFSWRIEEAQAGRPHAGPLSESLLQSLERLDRLSRYVVDRLRKHSRILEPDVSVNPYRYWGSGGGEFARRVSGLQTSPSAGAFQDAVDELLTSPEGSSPEGRAQVGLAVLRQCAFARADQVRAAVAGVLSQEGFSSAPASADACISVNAALVATTRFGLREEMIALTGTVRRWATQDLETLSRFPVLIRSSTDALAAIDGPHAPDEFLDAVSRAVLGDRSPAEWIGRLTPADLPRLRVLLAVAERWYRFGKDGLAAPVIRGATSLLDFWRTRTEEARRAQERLAPEVVQGLRSASPPVPDAQIEQLLEASPEFLTSPSVGPPRQEVPESIVARPNGLADFALRRALADQARREATESLVATLNGVTDPALRRSLVGHATLRQQAWEPSQHHAWLAEEIVQTLQTASRPVAASHLDALFERMPQLRDTFTTRSHFSTVALDFVESLCLTAVEVCSNG